MKIAWLYHDFMDLYGDKGNIMVLQKRCEDRGIPCQVDKIGIGDETDLCDYDLIFLGGGADKEQLQLIPDLMARRENIRKAMDEGTFALLICGGYQLFGEYYIAADGTKIDGLGFHSYYTDTEKPVPAASGISSLKPSWMAAPQKSWDLKTMAARLAMSHILWEKSSKDAATASMQDLKGIWMTICWGHTSMDRCCRRIRMLRTSSLSKPCRNGILPSGWKT